jgi:hypothetical protein
LTIEEEIRYAMLDGACTMFLIGILDWYDEHPDAVRKAIAVAGEKVRKLREVRIKTPDVTLIELVERQWM